MHHNLKDPKFNTEENFKTYKKYEEYFLDSNGSIFEKLVNFPRYVPRQYITSLLTKYELFKKIIGIQGSIVECGVLLGGGLMAFANFSAIFEPVNYQRKIIGFDTFAGFQNLSKADLKSTSSFMKRGKLSFDSFEDLKKGIEIFDSNRFLSHIPKIDLVKGDASITIPKYIKQNPETIISLLYLDFGAYKPTKKALKLLFPRIPKGGVVAFEVLNHKAYSGDTMAVLEEMGVNNLKLQRFDFATTLSYVVIE